MTQVIVLNARKDGEARDGWPSSQVKTESRLSAPWARGADARCGRGLELTRSASVLLQAKRLKDEEEMRKKKGDANGVHKKADATTTPDTKMPEVNPHTNTFERHQSSLTLMPMDGQREVTTTAALLKHTLQGEEPSGLALGGEFVFHQPPAVLMLQIPRHGSYQKAYERIFPTEHIFVPVTTKDPTYKKNALPLVTSVSMKLRAVVCIRQSHYVAYARMPVNEGVEGSRRWVFSDSMASNRKSSTGGFETLPCTVGCPGVRPRHPPVMLPSFSSRPPARWRNASGGVKNKEKCVGQCEKQGHHRCWVCAGRCRVRGCDEHGAAGCGGGCACARALSGGGGGCRAGGVVGRYGEFAAQGGRGHGPSDEGRVYVPVRAGATCQGQHRRPAPTLGGDGWAAA